MSKLVKIESFGDAVRRGIEAFEEAGRILVELLEADPNAKEKIIEHNPGFTEDLLDTFERIGRKQLFYKLTINESPGVRALRRCTYSDQVRYSEQPLELLLIGGKDKTDTIQCSIHALTNRQAKQMFNRNRVRTLGEQRAYLESLKGKPQPLSINKAYTISKGKITFYQPCTLTTAELARLLSETAEA